MRILVTGGAGFIGSNLVHCLLAGRHRQPGLEVERVVTLDKLTYAGNRSSLASVEEDPRHVFIHGDICDRALVSSLLREHRIDSLMHLAAESHVDRSIDSPEQFIQTNVVGTWRLLEEARIFWGDPSCAVRNPRFLHVSTDEVFGSLGPDDPAFCETTRHAPNSPYSASKAAGDHLARSYHRTYGLPVITTNCSNNYGPFQFPEKLIPLMILKILRGRPLPVYGDGSNIRDWIHVEDHCRALAAALVKGTPGETYLVGGRCAKSNIEIVHAVIEAMRELAPETVTGSAADMITFVEDRPGHDHRYSVDPGRIERELGWSPQEDFASGIRHTVQWYLDHEDWVRAIENGSYRGERLGTRR